MFSNRPNYNKLRTNLRLCINRLKLLEKKKTELALKARREIADYISNGKEDRARIRVEHIIREDYLVEAMEIVEMLCDLLLARFGLVEKMAELDPGLEEAISTLIWVTPRLLSDIQELREVTQQLTIKYGKEYAEMCRRNGFQTVNEKVVHKLTLSAPPKILVENYMLEIAKTYKVPFEPDPAVMLGKPPETNDLIDMGIDTMPAGNTVNSNSTLSAKQHEAEGTGFRKPPSGGGGGGSGMAYSGSSAATGWTTVPNGASGGWAPPGGNCPVYSNSNHLGGMGGTAGGRGGEDVYSSGDHYESFGGSPTKGGSATGSNIGTVYGNSGHYDNYGGAPAGGNNSSVGNVGTTGMFGNGTYHDPHAGGVPVLPTGMPAAFPPPVQSMPPQPTGPFGPSSSSTMPPPLPNRPPNAGSLSHPQMPSFSFDEPDLPLYDDVMKSPYQYNPATQQQPSHAPPQPPANAFAMPGLSDIPVLPDVPGLPSVPTGSIGGASVGGGDEVDFDDLTRRFEELKKRK